MLHAHRCHSGSTTTTPSGPKALASTCVDESETPQFSTYSHTTFRPIPFLHPTRVHFSAHSADGGATQSSRPASYWSSRASRKNRLIARPYRVAHQDTQDEQSASADTGNNKGEFVLIQQRLRHPHTMLKLNLTCDISFWVAIVFTVGSMLWVINGFILYLPLLPSPAPPHATAAAWVAFAGGTFFELGSYLMVVEAINAGHEQLFGPALWGLVKGVQSGWNGNAAEEGRKSEEADSIVDDLGARRKNFKFRWTGTAPWRELGFLASVSQLCGATIFWISTITGIPGVIPNLLTNPPVAITDVFYWTPQVLGGTGFIVSSLLLMIEVQRRWWCPNLKSLGWHIGIWNLVGAVGFTMCGALGYASATSSKVNYQSVLSTFWGSWAFLIGSAIQLWETLWRETPDCKYQKN